VLALIASLPAADGLRMTLLSHRALVQQPFRQLATVGPLTTRLFKGSPTLCLRLRFWLALKRSLNLAIGSAKQFNLQIIRQTQTERDRVQRPPSHCMQKTVPTSLLPLED